MSGPVDGLPNSANRPFSLLRRFLTVLNDTLSQPFAFGVQGCAPFSTFYQFPGHRQFPMGMSMSRLFCQFGTSFQEHFFYRTMFAVLRRQENPSCFKDVSVAETFSGNIAINWI